jgi:hypothetical protein
MRVNFSLDLQQAWVIGAPERFLKVGFISVCLHRPSVIWLLAPRWQTNLVYVCSCIGGKLSQRLDVDIIQEISLLFLPSFIKRLPLNTNHCIRQLHSKPIFWKAYVPEWT